MLLIVLSDQLPVNCLGRPLPYQQADRTQAHPKVAGPKVPAFNAIYICSRHRIGNYHRFHDAMSVFGEDYLRVTNPFAANPCGFARLACLIHAASVHSEPGSNSPKGTWLLNIVCVSKYVSLNGNINKISKNKKNLKLFAKISLRVLQKITKTEDVVKYFYIENQYKKTAPKTL